MIVSIIAGALDTGRIPEGKSVRLLCSVDANPMDVAYQWYVNDELVIGATLNELVSGMRCDRPAEVLMGYD